MHVGVFAHPWNVEGGGLGQLVDLGVSNVAMAVAYHAGRWTTPMGGELLRSLEDGVVHFAPSREYGRLVPQASSEVGAGPSPLQTFIEGCRARDVEAHAWTVLFHNSRLGAEHPELCVHNAVGDTYSYALCPAQPAVEEYGLALLRDIGRHEGLHTIEMEAVGFLGYRHGGHHEKTSFASDHYLDFLMSYCFCDACVRDLDQSGVDGAAAKQQVATLLQRAMSQGDAMQQSSFTHLNPNEDLRPDLLVALQQRRTQAIVGLLRKIREVVPTGIELTAHVVPDPMFTGSQLGMEPGVASSVLDGLMLTHYGQNARGIKKQWDAWRFPPESTKTEPAKSENCTVCVWPKAPEYVLDQDIADVGTLATERGLAGVRIYHAGLLPRRTLERACKALNP